MNLRCTELQKESGLLFEGGSITSLLIGENEWEETERKTATLISVL